ncbi:MAG TPA: zinc ribbon domain-containing protein [Ktedonobacteraceae bacterium]
MSQPQQIFCTNCGQPLTAGAMFCVVCGARVSGPVVPAAAQFGAGVAPGFQPPYVQAPGQTQDDLLLAALIANSGMGRRERRLARRARRMSRAPGARLRGCGCLLLLLAVLAAPFIGVALTSGKLHEIFAYVAVGMLLLILLFLLLGALFTRRGREALGEGLLEGIIEALLGGKG